MGVGSESLWGSGMISSYLSCTPMGAGSDSEDRTWTQPARFRHVGLGWLVRHLATAISRHRGDDHT